MKKSFLNICGRFNKNGERIKERGINLYMKNVIIKINPIPSFDFGQSHAIESQNFTFQDHKWNGLQLCHNFFLSFIDLVYKILIYIFFVEIEDL